MTFAFDAASITIEETQAKVKLRDEQRNNRSIGGADFYPALRLGCRL